MLRTRKQCWARLLSPDAVARPTLPFDGLKANGSLSYLISLEGRGLR